MEKQYESYTVFSGESAKRFLSIMKGDIKTNISKEKLKEILKLGEEMNSKMIVK